jgi:transposase
MARSIKSEAEAVWRERLRRFSKSGVTVGDFCRTEGVSAPSFYQWRKRLAKRNRQRRRREKQPKESFVPLRLTAEATDAHAEPLVEIHLPNGVRVLVPGGDTAALRTGIQVAGELAGPAAVSASTSSNQEDLRC